MGNNGVASVSQVYYVKKYHYISYDRQASLRQQKLVAISDLYPDVPLDVASFKYPQKDDWVVEYIDEKLPFNFMKVSGYEYLPRKHLYAKHYLTVSYVFTVDRGQISPLFMRELDGKEHLSQFSDESVYSLIPYLERQIKISEKSQKKTAKNKITRRSRRPKTTLKYGTRWPSPQPLKKHKFITTISKKSALKQNPNKAIDKLAWKIFNERYPEQQPKKGQIGDIRKEILKAKRD